MKKVLLALVAAVFLAATICLPAMADTDLNPEDTCEVYLNGGSRPVGCQLLYFRYYTLRFVHLVYTQTPDQRVYALSPFPFCVGNDEGCNSYPVKIYQRFYDERGKFYTVDLVYLLSLKPDGENILWVEEEDLPSSIKEELHPGTYRVGKGSGDTKVFRYEDMYFFPSEGSSRRIPFLIIPILSASGIDLGGPNCSDGNCKGTEFFKEDQEGEEGMEYLN